MLLSVENLQVSFGRLQALAGVSFSVNRGEVLGLVGESGSGKSLSAMAVMGLLPLSGGAVSGGSIRFDGTDLGTLSARGYRDLRGGKVALVTQNPMTSLDPVVRVGRQIDQAALLHLPIGRTEARQRTLALMERLRIPNPAMVYTLYPHQLSGGLRQRIVIAMALAGEPDLLIADEPTTALDVTVQAQIIQLLIELVQERDLGLVLITHDMGVVARTCDRVAVMYCGRIVETGTVEAIFAAPRHPYTQALIGCIPRHDMMEGELVGIPGVVPSVAAMPSGCRFHPRCGVAMPRCQTEVPALQADGDGHAFACFLSGEAS